MDSLLRHYVINGGPVMWALVPCSLLVVATIIQAAIKMRAGRIIPVSLLRQTRQCTAPERRNIFVVALRTHESALGRAIWHMLKGFDLQGPRPETRPVNLAMEEACMTIGDELSDSLSLLGTLYTVAPLLGIMGTVLGMMKTFLQFATAADKSVAQLSIGIQQAMVATLWGLGIAIVAFMAMHILQQRVRRIEHETLPRALEDALDGLWGAATNPADRKGKE